jgi:uncharacterized protein
MKDLREPLPRLLTPRVQTLLKSFPIVVLTGPRQTGKSTLIRELLGGPRRRYLNLDDIETLERAEREPEALLSGDEPITIDEVQRSPGLLLAIKRSVDKQRKPGKFLLSGSANLALHRAVSETLAGRAAYLTLYPFTHSECQGSGGAGRWADLISRPEALEGAHAALTHWRDWALRGGFPTAALADEQDFRDAWFDGYERTYLERDLRDFARIDALSDFRRMLRIVALRTGATQNQAEMGRDAGLSPATAFRYLNILEASYILMRIPPYAVNRTKRLVKSPRLYFCDPGLGAFLAGIRRPDELKESRLDGALLENLLLLDLCAWRESSSPRPEVLWWRTTTSVEVDFVLEHAGRLIPIEVKAGGHPVLDDTRGLGVFMDEYGKKAAHGILLHTGTRTEKLTDRIWAVSIGGLLGA